MVRVLRTSLGRLGREEAGFTLVELLLAMSIGLLVLLAAYQFGDTAFRSQAATAARSDSLQRGQVAADRITRDLRQAASVELATSQDIEMSTWVAPDSSTLQTVRYSCASGTCTRQVDGGPAVEVATDIANADIFNPEPDIDPRYVGITLRIAVRGAQQPITIRDGVEVRNRSL